MNVRAPSLAEIRDAHTTLGTAIRRTPTWRWQGRTVDARLPTGSTAVLKLELFQVTGSFKPRGALLNIGALSPAQRTTGVVAVSAGNHAIAVGYAAQTFGTTAKVVMPRSSNPARIAGCRNYGAEVILVENVHEAFAECERIVDSEQRTMIHPFEGPKCTLGTATLGLELLEDALGTLDAVVVPVGGGGLLSGVACAVKAIQPGCLVFGVEPVGADSMRQSFAAGAPQHLDQVQTIADSLGAPHAAPYSFEICRNFVDGLVTVDDDEIRAAMALLFSDMKLAVEPAGAASTAAVLGPLHKRLAGATIGIVVCGSNIDDVSFAAHVARGRARLEADSGQPRQ